MPLNDVMMLSSEVLDFRTVEMLGGGNTPRLSEIRMENCGENLIPSRLFDSGSLPYTVRRVSRRDVACLARRFAEEGLKGGCRIAEHFVKLSFINHTEVHHGRSESRDDDPGGPGRHGH